MGRFSTMAVAVSGLNAAQAGLYVTGHNMSNLETVGYTRQRTLQNDFSYHSVGNTAFGVNQIGLGTNVNTIQQLRNSYLDVSYRNETPKLGFYSMKYSTGVNIEEMFGEMESDYRTQTVLQDFWNEIHELSMYPDGLETRGEFINTAVTFIDKVNNVYDRLKKEQMDLNDEVKKSVNDINKLMEEIENTNRLILKSEISGDNANDYRDIRNNALDDLSFYLNINYSENPNGTVNVYSEGKELVSNGNVSKIGLRYVGPNSPLVEPVFTRSKEILKWDEPARDFFSLNELTRKSKGNDLGSLKGLLVSRGFYPVNYTTGNPPAVLTEKEQFNIEKCLIPSVMKKLDMLVNKVVTMVNDKVAPYLGLSKDPDAPYDLNKKQSYIEVFKRKNVDRFTGDAFNEEKVNDLSTLYSIGNIEVNRYFLDTDNLDELSLSKSGTDIQDNTLLLELLDEWSQDTISLGDSDYNINNFYSEMIIAIGVENSTSSKFVDEQNVLIQQINNKRLSISSVSLDEEMQNMMIYQHAYNASARLVNVIDSMIETILAL